MSNSAIIRFKDNYFCEVYLHWNGGIESVVGFLKYCELKGYRDGDFARFIQVVGNFFGGGNTIYLEKFNSNIDTDNGIYLVHNWKIVNKKVTQYLCMIVCIITMTNVLLLENMKISSMLMVLKMIMEAMKQISIIISTQRQ